LETYAATLYWSTHLSVRIEAEDEVQALEKVMGFLEDKEWWDNVDRNDLLNNLEPRVDAITIEKVKP